MLQLLAAAGLAVAQPLYDVMARHPELAIAHRLDSADLVAVAAVLSLGLGLAVWLVILGLSLVSPEAATRILGGVVSLTLGSMPLALLSGREAPLAVRLLLLVLSSGLIGLAYARGAVVRRWLSALALGALVFPLLFLWRVLPDGAPARTGEVRPTEQTARPYTPPGDLPPIVIVIFDELPLASLLASSEQLDAARFPQFAAFAAGAHWFRSATTVAQSTSAAVPALLTGRYPEGNLAPTAAAYPQTLFSVLAPHYELNVVESMTTLCGALCEGAESAGVEELPSRFGRLRLVLEDLAAVFLALRLPGLGPTVDDGWAGFWYAPQVEVGPSPAAGAAANRWRWQQPPQRFARFLARLGETQASTLHYLHLSLPHVPWRYLPDGRTYPAERGEPPHGIHRNGSWRVDEWEVTQGQQRHLLQLQYADRLLGRLLEALRAEQLFDRSLIVLTADHGAGFRAGDRRRVLTEANLQDIAHVPLLIKLPGQSQGQVHDDDAESVDIAPTIAAAVGADLGRGLDGQDLFAPGSTRRHSRSRRIYRSWFHGGAGKPWLFETSRLAETAGTVEVKNGRFPENSLYRIGRDRQLIGRAVEELPRGAVRAGATLEHGELFEAVDPTADLLPVHVSGQLDLAEAAAVPARLALALDGVVQAVSQTYGELPARRLGFTAMFDPAVLRPGRQRLGLYLVTGEDTLSPVRLESR